MNEDLNAPSDSGRRDVVELLWSLPGPNKSSKLSPLFFLGRFIRFGVISALSDFIRSYCTLYHSL